MLTLPCGLKGAAFGGVPPTAEERGRGRQSRERYKRAARAAARDPRRYTEAGAARAFTAGERADVLLSHAGPRCDALPFGSLLLADVARRLRPRVHLFGHYHAVVGPTTRPGGALLAGLEHLEWGGEGALREGSWRSTWTPRRSRSSRGAGSRQCGGTATDISYKEPRWSPS